MQENINDTKTVRCDHLLTGGVSGDQRTLKQQIYDETFLGASEPAEATEATWHPTLAGQPANQTSIEAVEDCQDHLDAMEASE